LSFVTPDEDNTGNSEWAQRFELVREKPNIFELFNFLFVPLQAQFENYEY